MAFCYIGWFILQIDSSLSDEFNGTQKREQPESSNMKLQISGIVTAVFLSFAVFSLPSGATPFTYESNGLSTPSPQLDLEGESHFGKAIDVQFSIPASTKELSVEQDPRRGSSERSSFALMTLGLAGLGFGGSRKEWGRRP